MLMLPVLTVILDAVDRSAADNRGHSCPALTAAFSSMVQHTRLLIRPAPGKAVFFGHPISIIACSGGPRRRAPTAGGRRLPAVVAASIGASWFPTSFDLAIHGDGRGPNGRISACATGRFQRQARAEGPTSTFARARPRKGRKR